MARFSAKGEGLKRLFGLAAQLKKRPSVKVGVLGSAAAAARGGGITQAELAVIHEYGAPGAGIPERSFLRRTHAAKQREWAGLAQQLLVRCAQGRITVEQALGLIGQKASADVRRTITSGSGVPPPLKAATIRRKGSSRPLVDTGRLLNAISYEVQK